MGFARRRPLPSRASHVQVQTVASIADTRCQATRLSTPRPPVPSASAPRRDLDFATLGPHPRTHNAGRGCLRGTRRRRVAFHRRRGGRGARGSPRGTTRSVSRDRGGRLRSTFASRARWSSASGLRCLHDRSGVPLVNQQRRSVCHSWTTPVLSYRPHRSCQRHFSDQQRHQ